jgi:hypothetical protein
MEREFFLMCKLFGVHCSLIHIEDVNHMFNDL